MQDALKVSVVALALGLVTLAFVHDTTIASCIRTAFTPSPASVRRGTR
jgi:hypothetical protein